MNHKPKIKIPYTTLDNVALPLISWENLPLLAKKWKKQTPCSAVFLKN